MSTRGSWKRWQIYIGELEEAMRICGQHLAEVERRLSESLERATWRGARRKSVPAEVVRRALDMPFFRDLLRDAEALGDLSKLEQPDFQGQPWKPGEDGFDQPSESRIPKIKGPTPPTPEVGERAPVRIAAAERALAQRSRSIVIVLDQLANSRNVSAVARTAEALGLQELHIIHPQGRPAMERTLSTYSQRWLDLHWYRAPGPAIANLKERGYTILAADVAEHSEPVDTIALSDKIALVFGGEQLGVSDAVREAADGVFHLPTIGFTSYINVSVAVGISLYALDRRMRDAGLRAPLSDEEKASLRPAWYAMLARGDEERERRYVSWVDRPPEP